MSDMEKRESLREKFTQFEQITGPNMPQCVTISAETVRDVLDVLREPPVSEMYFDADGALHFTVKGFPENEPPQKYVPSIGGAREFGTVSSHWYRCGFPECGFPIDRGDIYCRHCGKPIGWEPEKEWGGQNGDR